MPSAFRRAGTPAATAAAAAAATSLQTPTPSQSNSGSNPSSPLLLAGYRRGVKAWTGGIHLTSVGLTDLDVILGGGQPLGTCILLQEDRWTRDLALSITKYWVAEAISQDQHLLIPVEKEGSLSTQEGDESWLDRPEEPNRMLASRETVADFLISLPSNLNWEKQRQKKERQASSEKGTGTLESLDVLEEGIEEEEQEGASDEGLEVAWQYKLSVQRERLGLNQHQVTSLGNNTSNVFCHSYNLSGRMHEQKGISVDSFVVEMDGTNYRQISYSKSGMSLFRDLVALIQNAAKDGNAIRLLFFHTNLVLLSVALPLLLVYIRNEGLPVVVLICSKPTSDPKIWNALCKSADVIMSTEGFASRNEYPPPAEFRHLQGLLTFSKVSTVTASAANGGGHFADLTTSKRPAAYIYGCKRDHRKLHIPLLHIPPEEYAEGGGSVGSGVRSGAGRTVADAAQPHHSHAKTGMGCASNTVSSALDF